MEKLNNKKFIHPSFTPVFLFTLAKISFTLALTIQLVKKHCFSTLDLTQTFD